MYAFFMCLCQQKLMSTKSGMKTINPAMRSSVD